MEQEMKDKNHCNSSPDKQHHRNRTCNCYPLALEPNEKCSIHGGVAIENRCTYCGKFMRTKENA
jgi:hypothetical protein